jgi:hypothetical protein
MEVNGKDVYFIAVKLFLRDGDNLLVIHDVFDNWDLPGGRIKKDEFKKPLEAIIDRKVVEELGDEVKYILGKPCVFFRVERLEHIEDGKDMQVRIFAIGYEANYKGGTIKLGKSHDKFEWVELDTFIPAEKFDGGWLKGVEEYLTKQRTG